jgi:hypothetical protein
MPLPELSDEQRQLVFADGDQFAEACPGAGKTRAIAARFLRLTEPKPRKGIGLVSFTTAAIGEVRFRCGDQSDALLAPNFVGTFDRFINQFITRPVYVKLCGKPPRFRETWQGIERASFGLRDMGKLPRIELDWFVFDGGLNATLNERRLPYQYIKALAPLISTRRQELEAHRGPPPVPRRDRQSRSPRARRATPDHAAPPRRHRRRLGRQRGRVLRPTGPGRGADPPPVQHREPRPGHRVRRRASRRHGQERGTRLVRRWQARRRLELAQTRLAVDPPGPARLTAIGGRG